MSVIRSPRRLYQITQISVNLNDVLGNPDPIDPPGGTTRPIICKMKEAVGEFLGLTPLAYNDPIFNGVFQGEGTNRGSAYRRRLGGYKHGAYTIVAKTKFTINEIVTDVDGTVSREETEFKSITIGFPKGHSVTEVIRFLEDTTRFQEMRFLRSPAGGTTDLYLPA